MIVTQEDYNLIPFNLADLPEDDTFANYIDEQEEIYLRKLLGNSFYDLMIAAFAAFPAVYDEEENYALDAEVRSGIKVYKSFVADNMGQSLDDPLYWTEQVVPDAELRWLKLFVGETYIYGGFSYKWWGMVQMVKPLIYALWVADASSTMTPGGRTNAAVENGTAVDSRTQHCKGWNRYRTLACGRGHSCFTSYGDSLFGYLYVKSDDFDDLDLTGYDNLASYVVSEFCDPKLKNIFDI